MKQKTTLEQHKETEVKHVADCGCKYISTPALGSVTKPCEQHKRAD